MLDIRAFVTFVVVQIRTATFQLLVSLHEIFNVWKIRRIIDTRLADDRYKIFLEDRLKLLAEVGHGFGLTQPVWRRLGIERTAANDDAIVVQFFDQALFKRLVFQAGFIAGRIGLL